MTSLELSIVFLIIQSNVGDSILIEDYYIESKSPKSSGPLILTNIVLLNYSFN